MVGDMRRTSQGDEEPVRQEEKGKSQRTRGEAISRRAYPIGSDAAEKSSTKRT